MKKLILTILLILPLTTSADYCSGEWVEDAEVYCNRLMLYVQALTVDRNVNRPKAEVYAEVNDAITTYLIPRTLAENYIEFIWQFKPGENSPDINGNLLFGGCIDHYKHLQHLGLEDAKKLMY